MSQTQRQSVSIRPQTQGSTGKNLFMFRPKMNKNDNAALSVINLLNQSEDEAQATQQYNANRIKIMNVVDQNGVE